MGRKLEDSNPFLGRGSRVPILPNVAWVEAYLHTKWHLYPSSHLGTIDMGRKLGALPPFLGRGAGSPSDTMSLGSRPTFLPSGILIHQVVWPQQIWAENWGTVPLWGRGPGSSSNTIWPGPRPTCTPSFISIRPTVWPQYTNVTDWKEQTDNGPIA